MDDGGNDDAAGNDGAMHNFSPHLAPIDDEDVMNSLFADLKDDCDTVLNF
jgi:hypothetical protein